MTTPAHLAGGYLVLRITQPWWTAAGLTDTQTLGIFLLGLVMSVVIDLDVIWTRKNVGKHHEEITHKPYFWGIVSGLIMLTGGLVGMGWIISVGMVVLLATATHLFLDTFGIVMGVQWLAPVSDKVYSFTKMRPVFSDMQERRIFYRQNWHIFLRDTVLVVMGLLLLGWDVYSGALVI